MRCCQNFKQCTVLPTVSHAGRPLHSAARNTRCMMQACTVRSCRQGIHACHTCIVHQQSHLVASTWHTGKHWRHAPCCRKAPNHRALQHTFIEALARQRSNACKTMIWSNRSSPATCHNLTVTERHTQDTTPASQSLRTMRFLSRKKLPKGCIETCKMQINSLFLLQGCHFTKRWPL
jgi:hypothetical protein